MDTHIIPLRVIPEVEFFITRATIACGANNHYLCTINQARIMTKHIITLIMATLLITFSATAQDTKTNKTVSQEQTIMPSIPEKPTGTAFIVVSKKNLTLSVYDRGTDGDTVLVAQYPCCMGKNKGNKQGRGDMRTPESPASKPFKITMIQDASTWKHDFKDGRGNIKAYGHWFLRLETPGHKGIGIHGSTNNENTVPGRASEGCIRLLDKDIITLKEHFAYVGMPVTVQGENQAPFPWESRTSTK